MGRRRQWNNGTGTLRIADASQAGASPTDSSLADASLADASLADDSLPVEIAATYGPRRRGLLGRDRIEGAILLTPCNSVHTFRMRFTIDVAYLDRELRVIDVHTMKPGRLSRPRLRARHVLEAEAGAMAGWGVRPGVQLTIAAAT
ncbi:DUF192 domain-containing protein [Streptomyces sp. NPDC001820]|uniref:DUF192 domain-containing protein n=1 Tax=Streptomyces sp. NPDC001820 TaxID=3364613 RepID=UPI0036A504E1